MTKYQKLALALVILLAIFFRFYQITSLPGGLFPDEAANGLDINSMQQGDLQPFYERGNGREALFFYMLWGSVELFGKGPWQHHAVSALVGLLAIIGCFLVTRKLFSLGFEGDPKNESRLRRATWIALLAAFFMAVSTWHIVLSRTAFRANLIPLFTTFTLYFGLVAISAKKRTNQYLAACLAGALFALGFYTYIAYRIMVPIVAMIILWPLLVDLFKTPRFKKIKTYFPHALLVTEYFIAFILPIAYYFYTHEGSFVGRSGQVSVFNPELNQGNLIGTIFEVARVSVRAYFSGGDLNWRHNISGYSFLSQIISPFFGLGLIASFLLALRYLVQPFKRIIDWKFFLLTGWFWGMLLPVITTAEGIPHGLRSIGTIPAVFIIAAWALFEIARRVNNLIAKQCEYFLERAKKFKRPVILYTVLRVSLRALVVCFIATLIAQAYIGYFVYAANSPEYHYYFRSDLTTVSNYLNGYDDPDSALPAGKIPPSFTNRHTKQNTYLILDKFSVQSVDYFTTFDARNQSDPRNNPYTQVDPEHSWQLTSLKPGDEIVFAQSSIFDIKKFKAYHLNSKLKFEQRNKFGQAELAVYEIQ